ncbi:unnamed protein product [Cyprideis torosa]|uniref:Uncharacterized protein n=1 Tax=Cyprideis torosa TaxID=163714 RepID=A0A7R8ZMU0_9CRUS|nr:unnamed protein product [Cyprideis torosa]CAG0885164.1 unnamed protein product [Cyprideis torosa]
MSVGIASTSVPHFCSVPSFPQLDSNHPPSCARSEPAHSRDNSLAASSDDYGILSMTVRSTHSNPEQASSAYSTLPPSPSLVPSSSSANSGQTQRIHSWSNSFETLMQDPLGIAIFSDFLKQEFSGENIIFWSSVQEYKSLFRSPRGPIPEEGDPLPSEDVSRGSPIQRRKNLAGSIFERHLAPNAVDPVNVDSQARQRVSELISSSPLKENLFEETESQIYSLMKFDCYRRFLASDLYRVAHRDADLDPGQGKPKDEEKEPPSTGKSVGRRKSLLAWSRKGTRGQRGDKKTATPAGPPTSAQGGTSLNLPLGLETPVTTNGAVGPKQEPEVVPPPSFLPPTSSDDPICPPPSPPPGGGALCRLVLPDLSTTVVSVPQRETVGTFISKLLVRRGLSSYSAFDVFPVDSDEAIDLLGPAAALAARDLRVEARVTLAVELPSGQTVCLKTKPNVSSHGRSSPQGASQPPIECVRTACCLRIPTALGSVHAFLSVVHAFMSVLHAFMSVLHAFLSVVREDEDLRLGDALAPHLIGRRGKTPRVTLLGSPTALDLKGLIGALDGARLKVTLETDTRDGPRSTLSQFSRHPPAKGAALLDEITNRVFQDLMRVKDEPEGNSRIRNEETTSQNSADGLVSRLMQRQSSIPNLLSSRHSPDGSEDRQPPDPTGSQETHNARAEYALSMSPSQDLNITPRLYEGLKRLQLGRLEDQRGTEINVELPEFLRSPQFQMYLRERQQRLNRDADSAHSQSTASEAPPSFHSHSSDLGVPLVPHDGDAPPIPPRGKHLGPTRPPNRLPTVKGYW